MSDNNAKIEAFTFGDPEPVLDGRDILDLLESYWNGRWYEPPIDRRGLAKSFRSSPHHSSAIYVKRNILTSCYIPHPTLPKQEFASWVLDYLVFGDGYLERINNMIGDTLKLKRVPAKYMRRTKDDRYLYVPAWHQEHPFEPGSIFDLMEPDINQELYGVPEYLSALQSAWLNESATLFRRKYYTNGNHAGFVMYMTDTIHEQSDIDSIRTAMKNAKGPGNFRNLFMYAPGGKKDGIQIIPIAEVQAKDEFFNIKNVSRDDMFAGHRVPPQLMGVVPANAGGFGDVVKAATVFGRNEMDPLMARLTELNDWLGFEVIKFKPYVITDTEEEEEK